MEILTTKDTGRQSRNQRRKSNFYHEGHEEHEVKSLKKSMSETFVAFVIFVVYRIKGITTRCMRPRERSTHEWKRQVRILRIRVAKMPPWPN